GGGQLFSVYRALEERFAGKDLVLADNPDECVVLGCSLEFGAAKAKARPSLLFMPAAAPEPEEPASAAANEETEIFLEGDNGDVIILLPGENKVGRANDNSIQIVGEKISRFHAKIVVSEELIGVIDLGSTNGTFVNDVRLEKDEMVVLKAKDEVRFGDRSFCLKQSP
ncbi:MAG: FHA domain-containing protein, partial [Anaerolineaceae bacterium]|nr:FHA domain-containing protein [Anaerolineaceae bacterium]